MKILDMDTNFERYKTKDLAEAGVLIIKKKQLIEIERQGKICWFIFDDKKLCERISNEFFFGELLVNAREYYEALNRLKSRIFTQS